MLPNLGGNDGGDGQHKVVRREVLRRQLAVRHQYHFFFGSGVVSKVRNGESRILRHTHTHMDEDTIAVVSVYLRGVKKAPIGAHQFVKFNKVSEATSYCPTLLLVNVVDINHIRLIVITHWLSV